MSTIRKMLVPLDGSPPSTAALEHAVALAEEGDATIDVLYVQAPDDFEVGTAPGARDEAERARNAAVERAQDHLGERVIRRIESGEPTRKIVEVAAAEGYDLIVIGTHARLGRMHELLGSVTEAVVRSAPCPVLTVREPGDDYQSFAERIHHRPSLAEQVDAERAEHQRR